MKQVSLPLFLELVVSRSLHVPHVPGSIHTRAPTYWVKQKTSPEATCEAPIISLTKTLQAINCKASFFNMAVLHQILPSTGFAWSIIWRNCEHVNMCTCWKRQPDLWRACWDNAGQCPWAQVEPERFGKHATLLLYLSMLRIQRHHAVIAGVASFAQFFGTKQWQQLLCTSCRVLGMRRLQAYPTAFSVEEMCTPKNSWPFQSFSGWKVGRIAPLSTSHRISAAARTLKLVQ